MRYFKDAIEFRLYVRLPWYKWSSTWIRVTSRSRVDNHQYYNFSNNGIILDLIAMDFTDRYHCYVYADKWETTICVQDMTKNNNHAPRRLLHWQDSLSIKGNANVDIFSDCLIGAAIRKSCVYP